MYPILPVHQSISPLHSSVVPHTVLIFVPEMRFACTVVPMSQLCNAVSALAKDAIVVESKEIVPLDVIGHPVSPVPVAILVTVPPPPVGNNS